MGIVWAANAERAGRRRNSQPVQTGASRRELGVAFRGWDKAPSYATRMVLRAPDNTFLIAGARVADVCHRPRSERSVKECNRRPICRDVLSKSAGAAVGARHHWRAVERERAYALPPVKPIGVACRPVRQAHADPFWVAKFLRDEHVQRAVVKAAERAVLEAVLVARRLRGDNDFT